MKHLLLISVGALNLLHGAMHIFQFIQSMLLVAYSSSHHDEHEGFIDTLLHNPIISLLWAIIGIITLVIGIKDYRHHKKCKRHNH